MCVPGRYQTVFKDELQTVKKATDYRQSTPGNVADALADAAPPASRDGQLASDRPKAVAVADAPTLATSSLVPGADARGARATRAAEIAAPDPGSGAEVGAGDGAEAERTPAVPMAAQRTCKRKLSVDTPRGSRPDQATQQDVPPEGKKIKEVKLPLPIDDIENMHCGGAVVVVRSGAAGRKQPRQVEGKRRISALSEVQQLARYCEQPTAAADACQPPPCECSVRPVHAQVCLAMRSSSARRPCLHLPLCRERPSAHRTHAAPCTL